MARFRVLTGILVLGLLLVLPCASLAGIVDIEIVPPTPSSTDDVQVNLSGTFSDTCVPETATPSFVPGGITIATTNDDPTCASPDTTYSLPPVDLGSLGAGLHCVTVTYDRPASPPTPIGDPKCFTVADFTKYEGKASRVGEVPRPGDSGSAQITISGKFTIGDTAGIDLSTSIARIESVLVEGDDELVKGTNGQDISLLPLFPAGALPYNAIFFSPSSIRPSARLSLRERADDIYDFQLRITSAIIPETATACAGGAETVDLTTAFSITDSVGGEKIEIVRTVPWVCLPSKFKTVKPVSSGGGGGGTGGGSSGSRCPEPDPPPAVGDRPIASLRTDLITRNSGQPNYVELDGAGSSDKDGSVVEYIFRVFTRGTCNLVYGPTSTTEPTILVLLNTGEYIGSLHVKDNVGNESKAGQRDFSTP